MRILRLSMIVMLVLVAVSANAQFTKGSFLVGGSVNAGTYTSKQYYSYLQSPSKTVDKSLGLQLSGGYFVIDNLAVGGTVAWAADKATNDYYFSDSRTHDYSAGIFARYYIQKFYVISTFTLGKSSTVTDADGTDYQLYRYHNFTGGVGYAFMLNGFVAIEPQLTYSAIVRTRRDYAQEYTNTGMVMLGVAFQFYLRK